ncbi:hypothetical protein [Glycomyces xiaoerkulensis]|uniref:hypothetical protein n=1 Tax=Glycomyces xiaoerkulensis TaxID=2038139 RepID=UPI0012FFFBD8|nr:hypothetical protein [Glycomyces xiaoerkulensis]
MRKAGIAALAALTGLAAGCQFFQSEDEAAISDEDLESVAAMLTEQSELTAQIAEAQERLILDCVERQGHTVHDGYQSVMWGFGTLEDPIPDAGSVPWLTLDREEHAEWGFGVWTSTMDMYGSEEHLEFEELSLPEGLESFATVDNSEFEALSDQERFDWYVAYYGRDRAVADNGYLIGEFDVESDSVLIGTVEPGGCMGEVAEELGIEPEFEPAPDFGDDAGTWTTIPQAPGSEAVATGELDERVVEERSGDREYLDCLEEAGWGRWEFNRRGSLEVWQFVDSAYGSDPVEELSDGLPEPPSDVPSGAEERREWEIGLAGDMWDCVDRTGIDQEHHRAWKSVYGPHFLEFEEEAYAWQEDMRDLIDRAQEMLGS